MFALILRQAWEFLRTIVLTLTDHITVPSALDFKKTRGLQYVQQPCACRLKKDILSDQYRRSLHDIQTTSDCEVDYHLFACINTKTWSTYWYTVIYDRNEITDFIQFACCLRHKTACAKIRSIYSATKHVLMLWLMQLWNWYNNTLCLGFPKIKNTSKNIF